MKHSFLRIVWIWMLLLVAAPVTAWASGPMPPTSLFLVPPTPTLAPLPGPASFPTATPMPERDIPEPEAQQWLFLPFVGTAATHTVPNPSVSTTLARSESFHAASFMYKVRVGDTLSGLAIEFGRDQRSLYCARQLDGTPVTLLQPGQSIIIPALSDLCHKVKQGETLAQIADWYGVSVSDLRHTPQNQLADDDSLRPGQVILVANARSRYRDPIERNLPRPQHQGWRYGDGKFIWPVAVDSTRLSQGFRHGQHMAIDLAAPVGTAVRAADTGVVMKAGWNESGYGYRIVIDHGIDYITLYAHLSEYYVQAGDVVQKGEIIGVVGSTGNSTGPHLHFEVRDYGYLIDPLLVLPQVDGLSRP